MAAMIRDIAEGVEQAARVTLKRGSANYERLVTQLENILKSDETGKLLNELNPEIVRIAKERYARAYLQARRLAIRLKKITGILSSTASWYLSPWKLIGSVHGRRMVIYRNQII